MSDGKAGKRQESLALGIVLERRAIDNPWIDHRWSPVAVIPGAAPRSPTGDWAVLREGEGFAQFHAGTLPLQLFPGETEGYKLNLAQKPPRLFVVLRDEEDGDIPHDLVPFLVTACPYEAQDYLDSGEEVVEAVVMPEGVVAFVQDFVERHHVDQPFHKRKRKRAESGDEAFAQSGPAGRKGLRGNGHGGR
jgi:hypothetical protein